MLLQRRCAEGSATADRAINRARAMALIFHRNFNARSDGSTVGFHSYQVKGDPVVAVAGIFKKAKRMRVSRGGASDFSEEVFVSVIINVGESHTMAFVKLASARGGSDIHKILAIVIAQQNIRHQRSISRKAGSEIDIQESIVIHVAKIGAHGRIDAVESNLFGDVLKLPISQIAIKLQGFCIMRKAEISADGLLHRHVIAGDEQIGPAVVVVVEKPGGEAGQGLLHACLLRNLGEGAVVVVVIEKVVPGEIRYIQIRVSIIVVIGRCHTLGDRNAVYTSRMRDVLEGSVTAIVKQIARTLFIANEQIEEAIVIYIQPDHRLRGRKK